MSNYAYYRLPYASEYTKVSSERDVMLIKRLCDIGREAGFVIAPFTPDFDSPLSLIHPDSVETLKVPVMTVDGQEAQEETVAADESYSSDFAFFHKAVNEGQFLKLVLSREKTIKIDSSDLESLFLKACNMYPRLMIMLVSTKRTGTWLVASPEVLITSDGNICKTMALAGTMPYKEGYQEWSEKNQQEQHFVEAYIEDRLSDYSVEILKDGPHTKRAGNLVHLCTDFRFRLASGCVVGDVLSSLHPTPAVCGIPKEKARQFIIDNEAGKRLFYSGFMGPVDIDNQTQLYVSLRCARIADDGTATLYAGGGIMPNSDVQSEWEETEQKMKTIGNVLK